MEEKKIYNINAMRPAIVRQRVKGNKGVITPKLCKELGISDGYYTTYQNTLKKLFDAACAFNSLKNSHKERTPDEQAAWETAKVEAIAKIRPLWAELLSNAEKDKGVSDFVVADDDIFNIVAFAQQYVNDRNDVSLGTTKDFVAQRVWANELFSKFVRSVETDLGLRAEKVDVMSDEERDYLRKERKILSTWKRAIEAESEAKKRVDSLQAIMDKLVGDEAKGVIKPELEKAQTALKTAQEDVAGAKKAYDEFLHPETKAEEPQGEVNNEQAEGAMPSPAPVAAA